MAHIKRTRRDGTLLVGFRRRPGAPVEYGHCPNKQAFQRYRLEERQHHEQGLDAPSPDELFPPDERRAPNQKTSPTLPEWIGNPSQGRPGQFFLHAGTMSETRRLKYERDFERWVYPFLDDLPLRLIKRRHVEKMVTAWLRCPACAARAAASGVELTPDQLKVTAAPFDKACGVQNSEGAWISTHYPAIRRSTMLTLMRLVKAAFNAGIKADEPVCDANPLVGYEVPRFAEAPSNVELTQALSHTEIRDLSHGHPAHLAAAPVVKAYGLMRRSELFGLERRDIRWPGAKDQGVGRLDIRRVYVRDENGRFHLRQWGKTPESTRPVDLAPPATEALRAHMAEFRSTPNPRVCGACAEGVGEWMGGRRNPHRSCDFADDAPVFVDLEGKRQNPDDYTGRIFPAAVKAAGLTEDNLGFKVTPKTLRATGGTLMLEIDIADEVVARMGRWNNVETLKEHYSKVRDQTRVNAAATLGRAAAAELGIELPDGVSDEFVTLALQNRSEKAEAEVERLRALVISLGGDPDAPPIQRASLPVRGSGAWAEENLRAAANGARSQKEILERLGLALAGKNYRRLAAVAAEIGLTIPGRWGKSAA